jgi:hypothetical protein
MPSEMVSPAYHFCCSGACRCALPGGGGQHAAHLARQVDAGDLAEAQRLHEVVDGVHAHVVGQL